MEYSFAPFADPNQIHGGFYAMLIGGLILSTLFALIITMVVDSIKDMSTRTFNLVFFVSALILYVAIISFSYHVSFTKVPAPSNVQVIAKRVSTGTTVDSGKYANDRMFVVYRVPEGDIAFKMQQGSAYPDEVILYRK